MRNMHAIVLGLVLLVIVLGVGAAFSVRDPVAPVSAGPVPSRSEPSFIPVRTLHVPETVSVTVSAVGDCVLGTDYRFARAGSLAGQVDRVGGDLAYFLSGVQEVLGKDDLTIANLETTLTTASTRTPKGPDRAFWFRGDPFYVGILTAGSIEAVNLANNHSHDYEEAGFTETLATLESAGVGCFGNGYLHSTTVRGIRVALLGFNGLGNRAAGAGLTRLAETVTSLVAQCRATHDLVIVSFHWGHEYELVPTPEQITLGHRTIEAGADLVLGHHPHVVQGVETYMGRHIVYSLGNFVYGGSSITRDGGHTMIFQETFEFGGGVLTAQQARVIPASFSSTAGRNDYRPRLLDATEEQEAQEKIEARTALLERRVGRVPPNGPTTGPRAQTAIPP